MLAVMRWKHQSPTGTAYGTASGQDSASRSICSRWETPIAFGTTFPRHISSRRDSPAGTAASPVDSVTRRLYPAPCGSTISGARSRRIVGCTEQLTARSKERRVASSQLRTLMPSPDR